MPPHLATLRVSRCMICSLSSHHPSTRRCSKERSSSWQRIEHESTVQVSRRRTMVQRRSPSSSCAYPASRSRRTRFKVRTVLVARRNLTILCPSFPFDSQALSILLIMNLIAYLQSLHQCPLLSCPPPSFRTSNLPSFVPSASTRILCQAMSATI